MSFRLTEEEFRLFQEFMLRECGVVLGDNKMPLVQGRLHSLARECGFASFLELYHGLSRDSGSLRQQIIDRLTTHETFWFRDEPLFTALREEIIPQRWAEITQGKRSAVRIWSAACSTGQEPYSIAMSILEAGGRIPGFRTRAFEILGTDISRPTLDEAESGLYSSVAIGRGLPAHFRQRYFEEEGRFWRICREVRSMVRFRQDNLQTGAIPESAFDLIFCRNVAIYFSPAGRSMLFSRLARALAPRGLLFLGATESVSLYSNELEAIRVKDAVCYRVRGKR